MCVCVYYWVYIEWSAVAIIASAIYSQASYQHLLALSLSLVDMLPPGLLGLDADHVSPDVTNSSLINTPFYHKHFTVRVVVGVTCALSMLGRYNNYTGLGTRPFPYAWFRSNSTGSFLLRKAILAVRRERGGYC